MARLGRHCAITCSSSFGRNGVDVSFDYKILPPLTKPEILENDLLAQFNPFKGAEGTNFRINDPAIVAELDRVLEGRLVSISKHRQPPQTELDDAIKAAQRETESEIHSYLEKMDPFDFQWLVGALLSKLGYEVTPATRRSGDGGVDVRAKLVAGGTADISTAVQVKRQQSVGRPVVQNLRGALSAHEVGLVVTSGQFTEEAREEAKDPHKARIALIDGSKLVELLLEHELGVEHVNVRLYRLKLNDLSKEKLEELIGESNGSDSA